MKLTTVTWIGIRNVGSKEAPQFFEGTVFDSMAWLLARIKETSIKNRLTIVMGRTQEIVEKGLQLPRGMGVVESNLSDNLMQKILSQTEGVEEFEEADAMDAEFLDGSTMESEDGWKVQT